MDSTVIKHVVKRMKGGSESFLVVDCQDRYFVAKFLGNPQGSRTLINECIYDSLATILGVPTPSVKLLDLPEPLRAGGEITFSARAETVLPLKGWHLGSHCPVDPRTEVIYDSLPEDLLRSVSNLQDFGATFVLDRWIQQSDVRQAIFIKDYERGQNAGKFRTFMIDNGYAFNGSDWKLGDPTPLLGPGLAACRRVYSIIDFLKSCAETVAKVEAMSHEVICGLTEDLPDCWFSGDDRSTIKNLLIELSLCRPMLKARVTELAEKIGWKKNSRFVIPHGFAAA